MEVVQQGTPTPSQGSREGEWRGRVGDDSGGGGARNPVRAPGEDEAQGVNCGNRGRLSGVGYDDGEARERGLSEKA